jgi:hypothetical protein
MLPTPKNIARMAKFRPIRSRFLVHFFLGKFRGKFFPQKCWEKKEFSAEKVLKNHFRN